MLIMLPFAGSVLLMAIEDVKDDLEWDTMEVVPFENAEDREYVKVVGRINSTQDVALERIMYSNGSRDWNVTGFYLEYGNDSMYVNMSWYDTIVPNWGVNKTVRNQNASYLNGDLVYIVGLIYFEDGERCILARIVVYDIDVFKDLWPSYYTAAIVVTVAISLHLFLPIPGLVLRVWASLKSGKKAQDDRNPPKNETTHPDDPEPPPNYLTRTMILFLVILTCSTILVEAIWLRIYLGLWNVVDYQVGFTFMFQFLMISLLNNMLLGFILLLYPRILDTTIISDDGLFYRFGFSSGQFMDWENVEEIKMSTFGTTLVMKDTRVLELPLLDSKKRSMIKRYVEKATTIDIPENDML